MRDSSAAEKEVQVSISRKAVNCRLLLFLTQRRRGAESAEKIDWLNLCVLRLCVSGLKKKCPAWQIEPSPARLTSLSLASLNDYVATALARPPDGAMKV
jgi:hypothetical protein